MAVTLEQYVQRLVESGLFTADELAAFQQNLPPDRRLREPQDLARELIRAGRLTKFQAQCIYQGETKGLVLGDDVVPDRIGEGGIERVYKAEHKTIERVVALKTLPASATKSEKAVQRFHREVNVFP